jgi:hypothetical protein
MSNLDTKGCILKLVCYDLFPMWLRLYDTMRLKFFCLSVIVPFMGLNIV